MNADTEEMYVEHQLTNHALDAYKRDGFIVIPQLISPEEADLLRSVLLNLHDNMIGFKEGAQFDAVGLDDGSERRFPQILNPRLLVPGLDQFEYFKVGLSIAKQILGETARLMSDVTFLKPPRIGSATPWHQDVAFGNPMYRV